jgi:hypothetical protein
VQYSTTTNTVGHIKPGPITLYLVDPTGGLYRMHRWTASTTVQPLLLAWSGDKTEALFTGNKTALLQLDLRTGKQTNIRLQHDSDPYQSTYGRPDGQNLLAWNLGTQRLVVYRLNGTIVRELPRNPATSAPSSIQSANGSQFVLPSRTGLRLVASTGQTIRNLPVRAVGCTPLRYWNASTVLASCSVSKKNPVNVLWLVPTSGRTPRALTSAHLTMPDLDNLGAWRLPSGLYLQAAAGCGSIYLALQHRNGSTSPVTVPGTNGQYNQVVTVVGNRFLLNASTGCMPTNSLLWFNPASRAEQWLIKAPHNIQGVIAVIPFYSRENPTLNS